MKYVGLLNSCRQSRSQVFESGDIRKTGLTIEDFHERWTREFDGESGSPPFPQKKIEFGIGGDAISRCPEGLTCTRKSQSIFYYILFTLTLQKKQNQ